MKTKLQKLCIQNEDGKKNWHPLFFRLSNDSDKKKLDQLLDEVLGLEVFDEILGQVEEFVKSQNPKTLFTKIELTEAAKKHISKTPSEEYGVWVYYPWVKRLVHILDEKEFVEVRTNRNNYKITPKERALLSTKKIGIIGLSVGQSIALTIAMERTCGELRIADFDILELSNLNRIKTGLANLGINKTIAVAREIAEIDPFLKVTCFHNGISENNIDDFILTGGKLDVLVDECDGLLVKILCREKAKEYRIPVIMDTSDRGMIDVERFDIEPDRPILHGLIDHLDINKLKEAKSNEEKIPYMLPMVGIDKISTRLKASMMEVAQTITTWPQLASAVTFGGGLAADICRRVILDQFHDSGRFYVDVEELISDKKKTVSDQDISEYEKIHTRAPLTVDAMQKTFNSLQETDTCLKLNLDIVKSLVNAAILAPSGGNCQPWKWFYSEGVLLLFFEKFYSKSFLDYDDVASYFSLGSAFENLVLKANEMGLEVKSEVLPLKNDERLVARISFYKDKTKSNEIDSHVFSDLCKYIPLRHTNRNVADRQILSKDNLEKMKKIIGSMKGAQLQFADSDEKLKIIGEIVGVCDRLRFIHPQTHHDLYFNEVRWNQEENNRTRDGVDIETIPFSPSELAGFKLASDTKAIEYLKQWELGHGFEKISKKAVESASAIGFVTLPEYNKHDHFNGGRVLQRLWLSATGDGISVHPLMVPMMFFNRLVHGNGIGLPQNMINELMLMRENFLTVFNVEKGCSEVFLFKLFIADEPTVKSLRRPVEDVLFFG